MQRAGGAPAWDVKGLEDVMLHAMNVDGDSVSRED